jgi:hypothetical protein
VQQFTAALVDPADDALAKPAPTPPVLSSD